MRRALRAVLLGAAALGATGAATGIGLALAVRPDALTQTLKDEVEAATGLRLHIAAPPTAVYWPLPGVRLGAIALYDPSGGQGGPLLAASDATIQPSLRALARGEIAPGRVGLIDAVFDVADAWGGAAVSAASPELTLAWRGAGRSLHVSGDVVPGGRDEDRQTVSVAVALGDAHDAFTGLPTRVTADFGIGDEALRFDGQGALDPARAVPVMDGMLTGSPAAAARLAGLAGVALPPALAQWISEVSGTEATAHLKTTPHRLFVQANATGERLGHPISAELRLTGGPGWEDGSPVDVRGILRAGGLGSAQLTATWSAGRVSEDTAARTLDGRLDAAFLDMSAALDWLGLPGPARHTPAGPGQLTAQLLADHGAVALRHATLETSGRRTAGSARIDLGNGAVDIAAVWERLEVAEIVTGGPGRLSEMAARWLHAVEGLGPVVLRLNVAQLVFGVGDGTLQGAGSVTFSRDGRRYAMSLDVPEIAGGRLAARAERTDGGSDGWRISAVLDGVDPAPLADGVVEGVLVANATLAVPPGAASWHEGTGSLDVALRDGVVALADLAGSSVNGAPAPAPTRIAALSGKGRLSAGHLTFDRVEVRGTASVLAGDLVIFFPGNRLEGSIRPLELPAQSGAVLTLGGTAAAPILSVAAGPPIAVLDTRASIKPAPGQVRPLPEDPVPDIAAHAPAEAPDPGRPELPAVPAPGDATEEAGANAPAAPAPSAPAAVEIDQPVADQLDASAAATRLSTSPVPPPAPR